MARSRKIISVPPTVDGHVPQFSRSGREDMGRKVNTTETGSRDKRGWIDIHENSEFAIGAKRQRRGTILRRGEQKSGRQEKNCRLSQRREKSSKINTHTLLVELDRSSSK
jgi:hypothetical protein